MKKIATIAMSLTLAVAATGVSAAGNGTLPDGAIPLEGGGYALELKKETPDWYTPELHREVVRAGRQGKTVPLPEGADVDSALLFTGIRPGAWMIFPAWCTTNFVFGSEGSYYIGTAGHCAAAGDEVTVVAAPGVLMNIGQTVKSVDNGVGDDFALIQVRSEMQEFVNPSMAIIAGPTGQETPSFGGPVAHVGHGLAVGTGGTPRAGVTTWIGSGEDAGAYGWDGVGAPGDSGSGVRSATGAAVGNLTHLVVGTRYAPAYIAGTTIDKILGYAGSLATASLVPDPLW
ncbi:MAG: hypothetical protein ACR2KQ_07315 [Actinomycetota bacterium]